MLRLPLMLPVAVDTRFKKKKKKKLLSESRVRNEYLIYVNHKVRGINETFISFKNLI